MRRITSLCLILTSLFCINTLHAQIEIDDEKKVGVSSLPQDNVKLYIDNNQPTGIEINSNYDGDQTYLGLQLLFNGNSNVEVRGLRTEINNASTSSKKSYGLINKLNSSTTGSAYGTLNTIEDTGLSTKFGTYNNVKQKISTNKNVYGVYNLITPGGANTYGNFTKLVGNQGNGLKYGSYNQVVQHASKPVHGTYNLIINSGTHNSFGTYNWIDPAGNGPKFGTHNFVRQNASSDRGSYGTYNRVEPGGSSVGYGNYSLVQGGLNTERRGIYAHVKQPNGNTNRSLGLFTNVHHNGGGLEAYGIKNVLKLNLIDASSTLVSYGVNTLIETDFTAERTIYGEVTKVLSGSTIIGTRYGSFIDVQGGDKRYGIYVKANGSSNHEDSDASNDQEIWAGFFEGDLCVQGHILHSSDYKLKEDIKEESSQIENLKKLQAKSYFYKSDSKKSRSHGFIAQDFEKVFPDLVQDVKVPNELKAKKVNRLEYDPISEKEIEIEESVYEEIRTDETFKAINYEGLIPIMVKAIQELEAEVVQLRNEIKTLREKSDK